jgi:hypothetical protein
MMTEPKIENMDGDSFSAWLWEVHEAITERSAPRAVYQDGREWAAAAFNCNYDPKTAAYEWLRRQIDTATPIVQR